ncbi:hypothetical protein [Acinetobacter sp. F9]|uniref:hypothetical protein n=1 Tax=Acinetobacter sp. F9 TaxID=2853158 RepID=UPI001C4616DB|nr:hypothetical protein [Acinetobacter sp. F9]
MSSKEVKVKQIETAYEYAEKVIAQNQQIIRLNPGNKDACVAAHGQIDLAKKFKLLLSDNGEEILKIIHDME